MSRCLAKSSWHTTPATLISAGPDESAAFEGALRGKYQSNFIPGETAELGNDCYVVIESEADYLMTWTVDSDNTEVIAMVSGSGEVVERNSSGPHHTIYEEKIQGPGTLLFNFSTFVGGTPPPEPAKTVNPSLLRVRGRGFFTIYANDDNGSWDAKVLLTPA